MVHTYSEAAWARRRQRAIERGYIQQRPYSGRYMMMEIALMETMKCTYRSIVLHREHDAMTGMSHHFARMASRAARCEGMIGDEQHKVATRVHRRAGRAKHEVSRRMDDVSARKDGDDLVFCVDPWKGKAFPKQPVPLEQDDPWAAWRSRRHEHDLCIEDVAVESRCVVESRGGSDDASGCDDLECSSVHGHVSVLLDVVINQTLGKLANDTRFAAVALYEAGESRDGNVCDVRSDLGSGDADSFVVEELTDAEIGEPIHRCVKCLNRFARAFAATDTLGADPNRHDVLQYFEDDDETILDHMFALGILDPISKDLVHLFLRYDVVLSRARSAGS